MPFSRAMAATFDAICMAAYGDARPVLLDDHAAAALGDVSARRDRSGGEDRVVKGGKDVRDTPFFLVICRHLNRS